MLLNEHGFGKHHVIFTLPSPVEALYHLCYKKRQLPRGLRIIKANYDYEHNREHFL